MRRFFSWILLAGTIGIVAELSYLPMHRSVNAQKANSDELFYLYFERPIVLNARQDVIAVESKFSNERGLTKAPFYLRLQQHLQGNQERGGPSRVVPAGGIEVKPLGETYALVKLSSESPAKIAEIRQKIEQFPDSKKILPVLTRKDRSEVIVLPDEILISFKPKLSSKQIQDFLNRQNLEVIRTLGFTENHYLVRSRSVSGLQVLNVANQLNAFPQVEAATPNFIQSVWEETPTSNELTPKRIENFGASLTYDRADLPRIRQLVSRRSLMPLEWHLNSLPLTRCLERGAPDSLSSLDKLIECLSQSSVRVSKPTSRRTDIHAEESWSQINNNSREVVVAVIDSLIQWDHPDWQDALYTVERPDRCPGEVHGWDFSGIETSDSQNSNSCPGDPDTRISQAEIDQLRPLFQQILYAVRELSDKELVDGFVENLPPDLPEEVREAIVCPPGKPNCSEEEKAQAIRWLLSLRISSEFHGTMTAGTIASRPRPPQGQGLVGVAPNSNSRLLPVRAIGLGGEVRPASLVQALGYAAERGAEIISLSWGSMLPHPAVAMKISRLLAQDPKLVIVASAGNENLPFVAFPAGLPEVVAVGAITLDGRRAPYSNFGGYDNEEIPSLDVVAPGGYLWEPSLVGGILTTGGTWVDGLWRGIEVPDSRWGTTLDPRGAYLWVEGTSFSAPIVAGILTLMKGEDPNRYLTRRQLIKILKQTASSDRLTLSQPEREFYQELRRRGDLPASLSAEEFFFGSGLVNAEAALIEVKRFIDIMERIQQR